MARVLVGLLVILLLVLQYRLWIGPGSLQEIQELKRQVAALQQENEAWLARNRVLEAEVIDLKAGLAAIEERARHELGMIKEDEIFYHIIEPMAQ